MRVDEEGFQHGRGGRAAGKWVLRDSLSEKREGAWVRGEDGGEALTVGSRGGEHRQGREGRVYGDASHEHEPDPPPSAHAGAAAGGVGGGQAVADKGHGLLGGGPYRPGASRADEKAAGGDRH